MTTGGLHDCARCGKEDSETINGCDLCLECGEPPGYKAMGECPYCEDGADLNRCVWWPEGWIEVWCKWCRARWWVAFDPARAVIPESPTVEYEDPPKGDAPDDCSEPKVRP